MRLRAARKFLQDGDKVAESSLCQHLFMLLELSTSFEHVEYQTMQVKVIVNLKGRENEFRNIAIELIKRFQNDVGEVLLI